MKNVLKMPKFYKIRNEMNSNCEIWIRMIRQESNKNEFQSYKDYWEKLKTLDPKRCIYFHNIFDWGQLDGFKSIQKILSFIYLVYLYGR